jgi:rhomboid family GlyGly-CTERM serine protease
MISGLPDDNAASDAAPGRPGWAPATLRIGGVLLAGLLLGLSMFEASVNTLLRFDRAGLARGEIWRLASGHFVHLDWQHAALNVAALALIVALFGTLFTPVGWLLLTGCSIAVIDAGLWWLEPQIGWYVGLSGVLHGLLAAAALVLAARRQATGAILLALLVAKLAWEQWLGPLPGSRALVSGRIVTEAHLYGALGGLAGTLLLRMRGRRAPL